MVYTAWCIREQQLAFAVWGRAELHELFLCLNAVKSREFRPTFAFIGENLGPKLCQAPSNCWLPLAVLAAYVYGDRQDNVATAALGSRLELS